MLALALAAQILLAWDPSPNAVEYLVWSGPASGDYDRATFTTNSTLVVSNLVAGKLYRFGLTAYTRDNGSDVASVTVLVFSGFVQLSTSPQGPWTNYQYLTVPVQVVEPQRFVRVRLETQ